MHYELVENKIRYNTSVINPNEIRELTDCDVDVFPQTLYDVSHDASIFEVIPQALVTPKDVASLCKLVRYVGEHTSANAPMNMTARSAGTDMSGGPLGQSIIVDFTKNFSHIKEVAEGYAITEPGVFYKDFDKATLAHGGQILPSYPASREFCTLGGMISNNSGGEKTLTYGKTEKYIRRVKMVLADGKEYEFRPLTLHELEQQKKFPSLQSEIYSKMHELIKTNRNLLQKAKPEVTKNSSGYYLWNVMYDRPDSKGGMEEVFDLTKLIVGSQGTLGLITEIEFALVKPKQHSRLLVVFLKDLKYLGTVATEIMKFKPESLEFYDDHAVSRDVLRAKVPKKVLMAEFTASTAVGAVYEAEQAQKALKDIAKSGVFGQHHEDLQTEVTRTIQETNKHWAIHHESYNMLRKQFGKLRVAPFIDDFVVPFSSLVEFLPRLYSILDQYSMTYTFTGHLGDGNLHVISLMNLRDPKAHKIIEQLSVRVYDLVHRFGGSISGEYNDGLIRTPFVKMQYGEEVCKLFEETKKIWDPKGIFNPGKKVGGTLKYAFLHIVK